MGGEMKTASETVSAPADRVVTVLDEFCYIPEWVFREKTRMPDRASCAVMIFKELPKLKEDGK